MYTQHIECYVLMEAAKSILSQFLTIKLTQLKLYISTHSQPSYS